MIYQIYPRSFADSGGDGVGDLPGITGRLDYLVDLGVDAVWLSPFYASPMVDFGYDITDHCVVNPVFGTLADFDGLLAAAHARGPGWPPATTTAGTGRPGPGWRRCCCSPCAARRCFTTATRSA